VAGTCDTGTSKTTHATKAAGTSDTGTRKTTHAAKATHAAEAATHATKSGMAKAPATHTTKSAAAAKSAAAHAAAATATDPGRRVERRAGDDRRRCQRDQHIAYHDCDLHLLKHELLVGTRQPN
jgi:hypothetical protein